MMMKKEFEYSYEIDEESHLGGTFGLRNFRIFRLFETRV
jgi:hypothetical protein